MGEKSKVHDVVYSVDGVNYEPLSGVSDVSHVLAEQYYGDEIWDGECSGSCSFKIEKRHQSRKWKKKHGLLRRQQKVFIKRFSKLLFATMRAACAAATAAARLGETMRNPWGCTDDETN